MMMRDATSLLRLLSALLLASSSVRAFSSAPTRKEVRRVVVVGKIIIDEYKSPNQDEAVVSIGGGGPQAAFGAAAALAVLSNDANDPPLSQPVVFFGPVGGIDWTDREETALRASLGTAVECIQLIRGESLKTPRIQLWHDDNQNIQWKPLYDSFGAQGAGGLWRERPCARDILQVLNDSEVVTCHVVIEGGASSPGDGQDSAFLCDSTIQEHIAFLGVEPVVFPDETSGKVSEADVQSCMKRLEALSSSLYFVSPDMFLYQQTDPILWSSLEVGIRNGPQGSLLLESDGKETRVQAATLVTVDGEPVNPTGAGNAYAAAFTACRASGVSALDSACISSAVGAVFCEYENIPPWTVSVLTRIRQAAKEVRAKVTEEVRG